MLNRRMGAVISTLARFWPVYAFGEAIRQIATLSWVWRIRPPGDRTQAEIDLCREQYDNFETGGRWNCAESM
jgi:hypothetical protein